MKDNLNKHELHTMAHYGSLEGNQTYVSRKLSNHVDHGGAGRKLVGIKHVKKERKKKRKRKGHLKINEAFSQNPHEEIK